MVRSLSVLAVFIVLPLTDATLSQPQLLMADDRFVASFVAMGPQGTEVWLATRCLP